MPTLELIEEEIEAVEHTDSIAAEPWKLENNPDNAADSDWLFEILMC